MKLPFLFLSGLLLLAGFRAIPVSGAESFRWRAGAASVVITPDQPMWMAGYASRTNVSQGKTTELYAKALALQDDRSNRLVIVTLDLIGVPRPLRRAAEADARQAHGLPREGLLLNCSHTHSGPEFRMGPGPQDWAMFGKGTWPNAKSADEYGQELRGRIAEAVRRALGALAPASVSYQHARCGFAMNRRTLFGTNYNNFPNPDGPVDHEVPVLRVEDGTGGVRALLFGYACHNTTLALYQICGDYAGFAQREIESAHPGAVALFLQGCGGDQNPYPRGTVELASGHGHTLATAVEAALQTRPRALSGPLQLGFEEFPIEYAPPPSRPEFENRLRSSDPYVVSHARRMLEVYQQEGRLPERYPFPLQIVHFGNDLTLVGLAGETCVDYALRLKRELAGPVVWVAGYCNDVMAYIPSARLLREGGYEPHSSMTYSEIHPGPWAASVEDTILRHTHALDQRLRGQEPIANSR